MTDERRRYFRISDSVGISYTKLGEAEAKAIVTAGGTSANKKIDYASHFDNRIHTLLDACRVQSPIAAEILDLMNKKLNFLMSQMDVDSELMRQVAYNMRQVNISACGMAFANEDSLDVGQMLQLDILLHPDELHLMVVAEVVACVALPADEVEDGLNYFLRVDFSELNHTDEELLIQHIVKQQGLQLKQRRYEAES